MIYIDDFSRDLAISNYRITSYAEFDKRRD